MFAVLVNKFFSLKEHKILFFIEKLLSKYYILMYCHTNLGTKELCVYADILFNTIVTTIRSYLS